MSQNNDIIYKENVLYKHNKEDIYGTLLLYSDKLIFRSNDIPNFNIELNSIIKFSRTKYNSIEFVCNNASYTFSFFGKINQCYAIIMSQLKKHGYLDNISATKQNKKTISSEEYYSLGNNCYNSGDYKEAVKYYSKAIELEPDNEDYYTDRADCYKELGKWKEAISDYSEAIKIDSDWWGYYKGRADCYRNIGDYKNASRDYNKAIELEPEEDTIYQDIVECNTKIDIQKSDYQSPEVQNSNSAEKYYKLGKEYYNNCDYQSAVEAYKKCVETDPVLYLSVLLDLGDSYLELRKYTAALESYAMYIEYGGEKFDRYFNRAYCNYNMCKLDEALHDYTKVIKTENNAYGAYNNRGLIYKDKGELGLAIDDFTKAIDIKGDALHYSNRAECYMSLEEYNKAVSDYTKAIKLEPNNKEFYSKRATCYEYLDNFDNAYSDYTELIKFDKKHYVDRAGFCYEFKRYDLAIKDYSIEIKHNYNNFDNEDLSECCYSMRADCYEELDKYEEAIEDYNKAIELNPDWWDLYSNRADCYKKHEQYEEALEDYSKAIELSPDLSLLYRDRADCYKELEQYEEAISGYSEAIKIKPDSDYSYQKRGQCYQKLEQYSKAIKDFTKAIEIDSDWYGYYRDRADCYKELEKYEEAISDYSKTIKLKPDSDYSYQKRGQCYQKLKEYNKAIKDFTKAIEIDSDWWGFYKGRADCYKELEKYEEAVIDYTKAIKLNDDFDILSYLYRADCYLFLGKLNEAEADWELSQTHTDNEDLINVCNHGIELCKQQKELLDTKSHIAEIIEKENIDMTVDEFIECMTYHNNINEYTEILKAEPENAEAYFDRGKSNLKLKNYASAFNDFIACCILDESKLNEIKSFVDDNMTDNEEALKIFNDVDLMLNSFKELPFSNTEKLNFFKDKMSSLLEENENIDISKILDTNSTKGRKLDL